MAGQTAEELKAAGNAAYAAGDNAKALECYQAALQAADAEPIAHVLHSNASAAAARLGGEHAAAALDHARRCVELKPDWPKGYARVGAAAQLAHRPGEAEAALRRGLKACPASPEAAALQQELDRLLLDDGNQAPLRGFLPGSPAQNMRDFQAAFGERMHAGEALAALPCDAFRAAFLGDEAAFSAAFRPAEHISLRAWELRLPLTSVVVSGAQRVQLVEGLPTGSGHAAILRAVCEAGARVDARDIAGYTALGHATGHHPQLELARILLEHGANPSAATRFGTAPLHSAVMALERGAVALLLDAGADPYAQDLDGVGVEDVARVSPDMLALVHAAQGKHQEHAHLQRGSPCSACGKAGASKRCEACREALYCNRSCQRAHWKEHKKVCGKLADSADAAGSAGTGSGGGWLRVRAGQAAPYVSTIPRAHIAQTVAAAAGASSRGAPNLSDNPILGPEEQAAAATRQEPHKTFVVKVQVPLGAGQARMPMLIYNRDRSFQMYVDQAGGDAAALARLVRSKGQNGQKAYLNAYMEGEELVVHSAPLPTQPW